MLVDYSDSESDSDRRERESRPLERPRAAPANTSAPESEPPSKQGPGLAALLPKPKSRKHATRDAAAPDSGPKKIVVNLPKIDAADLDEPPPKKARTSGSSGLSALLPAPKRRGGAPVAQQESEEAVGAANGNRGIANGDGEAAGKADGGKGKQAGDGEKDGEKAKKPAAPMFVPQSLARKPIQPTSAFKKSGPAKAVPTKKKEPVKPKVSLFGTGAGPAKPSQKSSGLAKAGDYKPIMLETAKPTARPTEEFEAAADGFDEGGAMEETTVPQGVHGAAPEGAQDLETIAREAGLDETAMRLLYGRNGRNAPVNIATFSVDEEYEANEAQRASGVPQEVKPVRSIAPGRHQLSSLLNAAQSQKTSLEDSFAQGKRNRKEAGSRYGW